MEAPTLETGVLCDGVIAQRLDVLGQLPAAGPGHKIHVHGTSGLFEVVAPTLSGRVWRWWSGGSATQTVVAVDDTLRALEAMGGARVCPDHAQRLGLAAEGLATLAATYGATHDPFVSDALTAASRRCLALIRRSEGPVEGGVPLASPDSLRLSAAALERQAAELEQEAFVLTELARSPSPEPSPSPSPSPWASPDARASRQADEVPQAQEAPCEQPVALAEPARSPSSSSSSPSPSPSPSPLPLPEGVVQVAEAPQVPEAPRQIRMPTHTSRPVGPLALPSSPVRVVSFATYPRRRQWPTAPM